MLDDTIEQLRQAAHDQDLDELERLSLALRALQLWRIEGLRRLRWALDILQLPQDESGKANRTLLWGYLILQEVVLPPQYRGDWTPTWLPPELHKEVVEALEALSLGEVRSIFEPVSTGKHGRPYTLKKIRLLAVAHVEFQVGRGIKNYVATKRVATALGVSEDTLKAWRYTLLPKICRQSELENTLEVARAAGGFAEIVGADPDYGKISKGRDGAVDAHVLAAYELHNSIDLRALAVELCAARILELGNKPKS
jgi:hypothetical protein